MDLKYLNDTDAVNSGDDIAGTVAAVGSKVVEFRKGDRVVCLHHDSSVSSVL